MSGNKNASDALLTVDQVADLLGVSSKTVRRSIEAEELPHVRIGRLMRVLPDDLQRYIAARRYSIFDPTKIH